MAIAKKNTTKTVATEKLTVVKRLGCIMLNTITIRKNSNGNSYIPTPFGAVYARLNEVEPGLQSVVELSNGAYALNAPTTEDVLMFLNEKKQQFPHIDMDTIKDMYGL